MAPALRREVREIRALGAPAGDERQVERFLAATEAVSERIEGDPMAIVQSKRNGLRRPATLAERYGVESCPYG